MCITSCVSQQKLYGHVNVKLNVVYSFQVLPTQAISISSWGFVYNCVLKVTRCVFCKYFRHFSFPSEKAWKYAMRIVFWIFWLYFQQYSNAIETNFSRFLSKNIILTSESEYNERIQMNKKFKNVSSKFFWKFGYAQYFLTILTSMIGVILIDRTVALFHKISTFSHTQTKWIRSMLELPITDFWTKSNETMSLHFWALLYLATKRHTQSKGWCIFFHSHIFHSIKMRKEWSTLSQPFHRHKTWFTPSKQGQGKGFG